MVAGVRFPLNNEPSQDLAPRQRYESRLKQIDDSLGQLRSKDAKLGKIRVALVLAAIVLWLASLGDSGVPGAGWLGSIAFAAFFVVATLNEPIRDAMDDLTRGRNVMQRLLARLDRDWDKLATKRSAKQLESVSLTQHRRETASDLDLFGRASLFNLVSMAETLPGIRSLADWLSGPAIAKDANSRSAAIKTLAPMRDQRIRFYTLARQVADSSGAPNQFVDWSTGDLWLSKRPWLKTWAKVSLPLAIIAICLVIVGLFVIPTALKIGFFGLIAIIFLNVLITAVFLGPAHQIFSIAMSNRRSVDNYIELFSYAEMLPADASEKLLLNLRKTMFDGSGSANGGMQDLAKVARAGSLRQSAATYLVYVVLQGLILWDVRVLARLEDWQERNRQFTQGWFDALGEFEALMSLAALKDDFPDWTDPTWLDESTAAEFRSTALGHPLLVDADRVTNDVSIGPPGSLLLVTGSNMSGKSTMLRSVGLNVALAGAGAPVCAESLELSSVELSTSIRVSDDVSQGVSFYMAELNRLKSVVDRARELSKQSDRACLFLLDEILQGTNSRERQIAVVRVLQHLLSSNAIGAITTHDLELADEPEMASVAKTVHFREQIHPDASGVEQMTFDYKMRQGVSPTTNALRLLEMVGLSSVEEQ